MSGLDREQLEQMTMNKTALERAFEIARTGTCESVEDIRRQLAREGFDRRQIEGRTLPAAERYLSQSPSG